MKNWKRLLMGGAGLSVIGFIVLQLIPVGSFKESLKREENPPITNAIQWDSLEAEEIARKACYDCHSNETVWPWYSKIAPVSWLVTRDVNEGRAGLNFSEYDPTLISVEDFQWHLDNDMPPAIYLPLHPEAELTEDEKAVLLASIAASIPEGTESEGMDMEHGD